MTLADYEKDPNHITNSFIKYYYSKLSLDCSKLFQLYTNDAVLKHMDSKSDPFKAVSNDYQNIDNIKKYWKSSPSLANAKFIILTVNTIQNSDNSLVATIVGELLLQEDYFNDSHANNEILPTRTFIQTFILEPHPTKDIFSIKSDILIFIPDTDYMNDELLGDNENISTVELVEVTKESQPKEINSEANSDLKENELVSIADENVQQEVVEKLEKDSKKTSSIKELDLLSIQQRNTSMPNNKTANGSGTKLSPNVNGSGSKTVTKSSSNTPSASESTKSKIKLASQTKILDKLSPQSTNEDHKTNAIAPVPTSSSTSALTSDTIANKTSNLVSEPSKSPEGKSPTPDLATANGPSTLPAGASTTATATATATANSTLSATSKLHETTTPEKEINNSTSTPTLDKPTNNSTASTSEKAKSSPAPLTPKTVSSSWANALKSSNVSSANNTPASTSAINTPANGSQTSASSNRSTSSPSQSSPKLASSSTSSPATSHNTSSTPVGTSAIGNQANSQQLFQVFVNFKNNPDVTEVQLRTAFTKNNFKQFELVNMTRKNAVIGFYTQKDQEKALSKSRIIFEGIPFGIDRRDKKTTNKKKNNTNGYTNNYRNNNNNNNVNNDRKN